MKSIEKRNGIVLKNYCPNKQKLIIFDEELGKIEAIFFARGHHMISAGSYLCYYAERTKNQWYKLEGYELFHAPLQLARYELYFYHHVLELCYYFIPFELPLDGIFDLLKFLLYSYHEVADSYKKKLFLLRFFVQLGIYPEEEFGLHTIGDYLLSQPIDVILNTEIVSEKALERWLFFCIKSHPQSDYFKTMLIGYK
ncbi:MAG: hypothetical protein AB7R69_00715 [Candidatus Babeliales bacterium]